MNTRTAATWDLIRAADPLASVDVSGASEHPAAQELLHQITAGGPAEPSADKDVVTVLDIGPDRVLATRRRGLVAGLAAAAVVVLVVGTVVAVRRESRTKAVAPSQQTTAAGYSKALLAELPLPKGAKRVDTAPLPELKQSPRTGNGIVDAQVAWWTVPVSFATAVATVSRAAALPAHWKITVSFDGGGVGRLNGWLIEVRDPAARFVSSVNVTVAARGGVVGIAAQVDTYAIPVRTPEQIIPASADSATFTVAAQGGQGSSIQRTLVISDQRVKTLAKQINTTPTFVMLVVGAKCPAPRGTVTVTFRSGSSRWSLDINNGSFLCNAPALTGMSGTVITLTPSTALLTDVLAVAGLPSNYLRR